jgi:hypothetical protein
MTPLPFLWDGEAMRVLPGFQRQADAAYVIGERYRMAPVEDRSDATHRHEFAFLRDAWMNLPEGLSSQFPTAEVLRKWALIQAGFCTVTDHVCQFRTEAKRTADILRAQTDDYAVVVVEDRVVRVLKAKSQSRRSMDKAEFQASKEAILDIVAGLIGVTPEALAANDASNNPSEQTRAA